MASQKKVSGRVAAVFIVIFGLIFASIGAGFTYFSYSFAQRAVATSGVVTNVEINRSSNNDGGSSVTYQPTISFMDLNGVSQSAETFLSSSSYNYARGTKLRILYDPDDPSSMRIDSWFALWGFGLIFLAVGLGTMVIALVVLAKSKARAASIPVDEEEETSARAPAKFSYSSQDRADDTPRTPTVRR